MLEFMHYGQVANFKLNNEIDLKKLQFSLNSMLKKAIVIKKIEEVEESFHARYSCKNKKYRYVINNSISR